MVDGFQGERIQDPKIISRGMWTLTGNAECRAYTPLKRSSTITSGLRGVSGVYYTRLYADVYDDISGISGSIGVSINHMKTDTTTGLSNINYPSFRRQFAVLHWGLTRLSYVSGTLDGTPVELKWGDKVAPCISGFRAYEEINVSEVTGATDDEDVLHTGVRQQVFGTYMDVPSSQTGTTGQAQRYVLVHPNTIYGVHK